MVMYADVSTTNTLALSACVSYYIAHVTLSCFLWQQNVYFSTLSHAGIEINKIYVQYFLIQCLKCFWIKVLDGVFNFFFFFTDSGAGPRISGLHGSAGFWAQIGPDHHAQTCGHSGGTEETNEGIKNKKIIAPHEPVGILRSSISSILNFHFTYL